MTTHPIATLDIGTSRITCLITEPLKGTPHVLGYSAQLAQGFKNGAVSDTKTATQTLMRVYNAAVKNARRRPHTLWVSLSLPTTTSHITLPPGISVDEFSASPNAWLGRMALPFDRHSFSVLNIARNDGNILTVQLVNRADLAALETLLTHIGLPVADIASEAALAVTAIAPTDATLVLSVGAYATHVAIAHEKEFTPFNSVPVGGGHITQDLAQVLEISTETAERIKVLHGNALIGMQDKYHVLQFDGIEPRALPRQVPQQLLNQIINARALELADHVHSRLTAAIKKPTHIILTGGGALLAGLPRLFQEKTGLPTSLASFSYPGLFELGDLNPYATHIGLIKKAALAERTLPQHMKGGKITRAWRWLKENV